MNPLPKDWRETAQRIQTEVNAFNYVADLPGEDKWGDIDEGKDCDNFAIGKLNRLVKAGFPIERLKLATCYIGADGGRAQGEGHAVLVVAAKDDNYVLDNRRPDVVPVFVLIGEGILLDRIQETGGSHTWIKWIHN